jgi:hypothetical protein
MIAKTIQSSLSKGEAHTMKKLMTLMLGMALAFGTTVAFAQEKGGEKKEEGKKGGKKGGKKKDGDTKKEGDKK